jgi:hypothetical protein
VLTEAMAAGGEEAKRAFDAMMGMKKIDVAAIKAARLTSTDHRWLMIASPCACQIVRSLNRRRSGSSR